MERVIFAHLCSKLYYNLPQKIFFPIKVILHFYGLFVNCKGAQHSEDFVMEFALNFAI